MKKFILIFGCVILGALNIGLGVFNFSRGSITLASFNFSAGITAFGSALLVATTLR